MVTIEEEARKLFEKGKKPEEVYEILSEKGIKASESTIETYNRLWRNGYESQSAYLDDLAKKNGFKSWSEYRKHLLMKNGFEKYSEYSKYSKDPHFREICDSNGSDGINEDNPYILMSRISEMEYILREEITETEEYKKLEEILEKMGQKERIKYIGKLRRGVEILKQLGKINYGSFSILYSV